MANVGLIIIIASAFSVKAQTITGTVFDMGVFNLRIILNKASLK